MTGFEWITAQVALICRSKIDVGLSLDLLGERRSGGTVSRMESCLNRKDVCRGITGSTGSQNCALRILKFTALCCCFWGLIAKLRAAIDAALVENVKEAEPQLG